MIAFHKEHSTRVALDMRYFYFAVPILVVLTDFLINPQHIFNVKDMQQIESASVQWLHKFIHYASIPANSIQVGQPLYNQFCIVFDRIVFHHTLVDTLQSVLKQIAKDSNLVARDTDQTISATSTSSNTKRLHDKENNLDQTNEFVVVQSEQSLKTDRSHGKPTESSHDALPNQWLQV